MSNEIPEYNSNIVESGVKGIQAVRIDSFYIKSCQCSMFYTNCS